MAQTVIGFFENNLTAYKAVDALTKRGIRTGDIDITREEGSSEIEINKKPEDENGFTRFFKNLFGDSKEADQYSRVGRSGCTLVTVHARSADEAAWSARLLDDFGALDVDAHVTRVSERSERLEDQYNNQHREERRQQAEEHVVTEERRGENRSKNLRSRIVDKPLENSERLRNEPKREEENPIGQAASHKEWQSFQEGSLELTERKEIPIVDKEARVVEEIKVQKKVEEHDATLHEKVRRTEVNVDRINESGNRDEASRTYDDRMRDDNSHLGYKKRDRDIDDDYEARRTGDPLFGV